MLPFWLSSWYQQQQVQEPFNDQYEAAADEDGEWVEVITPSTKRRQPQQQKTLDKNTAAEITTTTTTTATTANEPIPSPVVVTAEPVVKGLSRQERRANARFSVKEKKKQARNAAMALNRNRKVALPTEL